MHQTDLNSIILLPQLLGLEACATMPVSCFHAVAVVSHSDYREGKCLFALQFQVTFHHWGTSRWEPGGRPAGFSIQPYLQPQNSLHSQRNMTEAMGTLAADWLAGSHAQPAFLCSSGSPGGEQCHLQWTRPFHINWQSRQSSTDVPTGQPDKDNYSIEALSRWF